MRGFKMSASTQRAQLFSDPKALEKNGNPFWGRAATKMLPEPFLKLRRG